MTEKPDILKKDRNLCDTCAHYDWGMCWAEVEDLERDRPKLPAPVVLECDKYRICDNGREEERK